MPYITAFLRDFYTAWHPNNKTVIVNQDIWGQLNPREKLKVGLIVLKPGSIEVNNKVRMHTELLHSITKDAAHIWKIHIPRKFLVKLRAKDPCFNLTEFDEWHFTQSPWARLTFFPDDFHYYRYYQWPGYHFSIFGSFNKLYHKWFRSSYSAMDKPDSIPISHLSELMQPKNYLKKISHP